MLPPPQKELITAVVLAGGRGSRMGGVDKGLQLFNGVPLVQNALQRLLPQVGNVIINANRNMAEYESFGVPVWADDGALGEFAGPLAGMTTALRHCKTPYLLTVPCDAPLFPLDLAARLANVISNADVHFAVASAPQSGRPGEPCRPQPVFSLMKAATLQSLLEYTQSGGRKVSVWMLHHRLVHVPFNLPGDAANAFFNANTLEELQQAQLM
jgi:molybdenum cofactor guanylyltransferase